MPRAKARQISDAAFLAGLLKIHIDQLGVPETARAMSMSAGTLYSRLRNPENLTLGELMQLRRITGMDKALLMQSLENII